MLWGNLDKRRVALCAVGGPRRRDESSQRRSSLRPGGASLRAPRSQAVSLPFATCNSAAACGVFLPIRAWSTMTIRDDEAGGYAFWKPTYGSALSLLGPEEAILVGKAEQPWTGAASIRPQS